MNETVQEYISRLVGYVGDRDPAAILADTPGRLQSLVHGATPEDLRWTTSPDRWTVTQIVAHLADAEIAGAWRIRTVLERDGVTLQAYDQDIWASAFHYESAPIAESVALFVALRTVNLRIVRVADAARRQHAGLHTERGRESIDQILLMYAGHDLNHLGQIERLLDEARHARA